MTAPIITAPGTPIRLDVDCPRCGWSDVWQIEMHSLTAHGVGTIAVATWCFRYRQRVTVLTP